MRDCYKKIPVNVFYHDSCSVKIVSSAFSGEIIQERKYVKVPWIIMVATGGASKSVMFLD